jgi:mannose-6-phosphate isomerase-like protein (cupin superfamily)
MNANKSVGITTSEALDRLRSEGTELANLMQVGNLSIDIFKPSGVDNQMPHDRDEVYMIISGKGILNCDNKRSNCKTGDIIYVPAHKLHRFENFSNDFCAWAVFTEPVNVEQTV